MMPNMRLGIKYQHEYEAAMGRLLVKFNELEMLVGQILEGAVTKLVVPHLYKPDAFYAQKIERLELALCALPDWPKPDFERLRRINGWRNDMAHGHFHQDPHTGEYQTRPVHKTGKKGQPSIVTPDDVDKYTDAAREAWIEVSQLLVYIWFDDLPDELPPGVEPTPLPKRP